MSNTNEIRTQELAQPLSDKSADNIRGGNSLNPPSQCPRGFRMAPNGICIPENLTIEG